MGQLLIGALFFAMRSCEYSSTPKQAEKKRKLLRLKNLRFFNRDKEGFMAIVPHHSTLQDLQQAECISITFDDQKNGEKDACITQHRAFNGTNLCPVEAWAALVKRILAYPNSSEDTTVNTFQTKGKLKQISSTQTKNFITSHVKSIGERKLDIYVKTVGTHSLRSSCAMLLYLSNVRTSTIMLLGRWKSDAFLLYLQQQSRNSHKRWPNKWEHNQISISQSPTTNYWTIHPTTQLIGVIQDLNTLSPHLHLHISTGSVTT